MNYPYTLEGISDNYYLWDENKKYHTFDYYDFNYKDRYTEYKIIGVSGKMEDLPNQYFKRWLKAEREKNPPKKKQKYKTKSKTKSKTKTKKPNKKNNNKKKI
jgi:hypothetical protein